MHTRISSVEVLYRKPHSKSNTVYIIAVGGRAGCCDDEFIAACLRVPRNKTVVLSALAVKRMRAAVRAWCADRYGTAYSVVDDTLRFPLSNRKPSSSKFTPLTSYAKLRVVRNVMEVCKGTWHIRWSCSQ